MKRKIFNISFLIITLLALAMVFLPVCSNETETVYGFKAIFGSGKNQDTSPLGVVLLILLIAEVGIAYARVLGRLDKIEWRIFLILVGFGLMSLFLMFNRTVMLKGADYPEIWVNTLKLGIGAVLGALFEILGSILLIVYSFIFKGDENE